MTQLRRSASIRYAAAISTPDDGLACRMARRDTLSNVSSIDPVRAPVWRTYEEVTKWIVERIAAQSVVTTTRLGQGCLAWPSDGE